MSEIISVIDGLDLVVALADGQVHPGDLARARSEARRARERRGHLGGTLVLALLGGTGSGKSSLLNALAGEAVAAVSPVRPHTAQPLAWVPAGAEPALGRLLDRLGVEARVTHERFPGLALLDLTDVDSVAPGHRSTVERLLPDVDGIIWVLDPEKYHDPVLHDEFIAPLADSADQFLFVLNQIDRLAADEVEAVYRDLVATLEAEGVDHPLVFAVAAAPPGRAPLGVEALAAHLRHRLNAKRLHLGRLLAGTRRTARSLADAAGLRQGGTLHFEERWAETVDRAVASLAAFGPTSGVMEEAIGSLEDLVGRLAAEGGGPFAPRLRHAFPTSRLQEALRRAAAHMDAAVPPALGRSGRRVVDPERRAQAAAVAAEDLQRLLGAPLRQAVWERAALAASVAGVTVEALQAEAALQRLQAPPAPAQDGPP
ncbi:MAG: ribosome-binding GTPase [Actinobacteria bacterium]|nr:ribosome-binding GTPase [Actinomycetota bacterium]